MPNKRWCGDKWPAGRVENISEINNWGGWNKRSGRRWKIENIVF